MPAYRCYFLTADAAIAGVEIIEERSDAEAVMQGDALFAEKASRFSGYELWCGARRVPHAPPVRLSPDDSPERIRWWRIKAEELRTAAEAFTSPSARAYFQSAAETYEALANHAEARLQRGHKPVPEAG